MKEHSDDTQKPMADFQRRAEKAFAIADDKSLPRWRRTLNALQAFSGMALTGLPPKVYGAIEEHFVAVNRILHQYDLKKALDYEHMTKSDLQGILDLIKALASRAAPAASRRRHH
jgi:hypothetical protein